MYFYLSFANEEEWLGACIVEEANDFFALTKSHVLGINPGGDVQIVYWPEEYNHLINESNTDKLMDLEEIQSQFGDKIKTIPYDASSPE